MGLPHSWSREQAENLARRIRWALRDYADGTAIEAADDPAGARAEWTARSEAVSRALLETFANGAPNYRHRILENLLKGMPSSAGDDRNLYLSMRLLLARGMGSDWKQYRTPDGDPDPVELLYLAIPRMLEIAQAVLVLSERATDAWHGAKQHGGTRGSVVVDSLMHRLAAIYLDATGEKPAREYKLRPDLRVDREMPGGRSLEWFRTVLAWGGLQPTPDALDAMIRKAGARTKQVPK